MECKFCGANIGKDAHFCSRCGRTVGDKPIGRLIGGTAQAAGNRTAPQKEAKQKSLLLPLLGFIFCLLALCLCVFIYSETFVRFYSFMAGELAGGSFIILAAFALILLGGYSLVKVLKRL